jgi:hypothetical protein
MRLISFFISVLTMAACIASLFLPGRIGNGLILASFVAVGLWSLLFPAGMLGWAKAAHPEIDPSDESWWWLPRLIGAGFLAFVAIVVVMTILHRR